ncbi:hypothetical protein ACI8AV_13670 [Geodermatophilus sp. SYSU D00804]
MTGPERDSHPDAGGAADHYPRMRDEERAVQRTVAHWPEVVAALREAEPSVVRLLCPRGHLLFPAILADMDGWGLRVVPAQQDRPDRGRVTATRVDPIPLLQPGPLRDMTDGRTRLDCRRCSYSGVVRPARLLELYAVALRLGRREITMPR